MPVTIDNEEYYNTKEACEYLGVSRETIDNLVRNGQLKRYKRGVTRNVYYLKSELDNIDRMKPVDENE